MKIPKLIEKKIFNRTIDRLELIQFYIFEARYLKAHEQITLLIEELKKVESE